MNDALNYAENVLGVHKCFDEANALDKQLDELLGELDKAQDSRRSLDEKISDHEMDILLAERAKHADHSEAAFTRHLKEVYYKDATLRGLKQSRNNEAGKCSGLELDIEYTKSRIKTAQARMHELGGYFQFLAAVKLASMQAEKTPSPDQENHQ